MRRALAVSVLAACGGPARPAAPPSRPGSKPIAAPAPVVEPAAKPAVEPAPVAAQTSLLETFDQGELERITITEVNVDLYPGCAPKTGPTWIVSATDAHGDGATCMGDGSGDPACVMYAGTTPDHVAQVMCKQRATTRPVDVPAWAPRVLASLRGTNEDAPWQVTPIQDAVRPAVAIVVDTNLHIAVRTAEGWRRTSDVVDQMNRLTARKLIDTTALTGAPSFGVITSSYSGGSESGTETTSLTVLTPTATGLALAGTIQIGQFTWILAAEDRRKYPGAPGDMDARPHVDVQLAPRIDGNTLVLDVAHAEITKELAGKCKRAPDGDDLNAPCIFVDRKAAAGRYKLANLDFQRVP